MSRRDIPSADEAATSPPVQERVNARNGRLWQWQKLTSSTEVDDLDLVRIELWWHLKRGWIDLICHWMDALVGWIRTSGQLSKEEDPHHARAHRRVLHPHPASVGVIFLLLMANSQALRSAGAHHPIHTNPTPHPLTRTQPNPTCAKPSTSTTQTHDNPTLFPQSAHSRISCCLLYPYNIWSVHAYHWYNLSMVINFRQIDILFLNPHRYWDPASRYQRHSLY